MKNRRFLFTLYTLHLTLFILCPCSTSYAAKTNFSSRDRSVSIKIEKARKDIRLGEKFTYSVYWMGIPVGEGILEVREMVNINGREAYHIVATAKTNDFLSKIYKVEDVLHSYVDKKDLCALRFEKHQREGSYKSDEVVIFDQDKRKGHYESLLNKSKKDFDIPPNVHDLVSCFYYFRTLDVKPHSAVMMDVNAYEKNWKVTMDVLSTQQLEIPRKGVYNVFCVEPKAPFKGVISRRGKVWIYFGADEERAPVLIKIRVPFGFVAGILEKKE